MKTVPITLVILLSLVLGATVVVQRRPLVAERARAITLALAVSNAEAERDSTRELARLGDSLRVFERRVV